MELRHVARLPNASRETCAPPSSELPELEQEIRLVPNLENVLGTERLREPQRVFGNVDADDACPKCPPNHDGGQANAATAVNRQPFARREPGLRDHRAKGRHKPAAQTGCRHKVQFLRQPDQVPVRPGNGYKRSKRTPGREARLKLVVAQVLVPGLALRATTASDHERQGHAVACLPAMHLAAGCLDDARHFVTGHVRETDIGIVSHPGVPITAANAIGQHPNDHAIRWRLWIGHRLQRQRPLELFEDDSVHIESAASER